MITFCPPDKNDNIINHHKHHQRARTATTTLFNKNRTKDNTVHLSVDVPIELIFTIGTTAALPLPRVNGFFAVS
jgi:hypothetical protein